MKRYIYKLQEKSVYDKSEDEWFIGFDKNSVEEMLSDIEDEIYLVEDLIEKNKLEESLQLLENLREKLWLR